MLISVVISVLNEKESPGSLLESLAAQTGAYEPILVATDDAVGLNFLPSEDRVKVVSTPGVSRASHFNAGAAAASGQVLLFMEAATRLPANALAAIERNFQLLPQSVGGNFHPEFEPDSLFAKFLKYSLKWWRYRGSYGSHSAIFVRTEVFEALHSFKPDLKFADFEFAHRLEQIGPTLFLHEPVIGPNPGFYRGVAWLIAPILTKRKA
jgi:hypothetical protein